jgi:glycosyltransferase involved in cell wall biosynthesis
MVSVLMAVYDTAPDMLEQAISSIRRQTYRDFEFLILDDGSRDERTQEVLKHHAGQDPRIHLYWEPHRGLTATLNRGLQLARGVWIARQDADDWSDPRRLERQLAALSADPNLGLCGTNAWTHQQNGAVLWATQLPERSADVRRAFWLGNPFVHGSTMFRRVHAIEAGGYREQFPCSQDYDFFWRLSERTGALNLAEPLYHYRYSGGAVSARRAAEQARAHGAAQRLARLRQRGEAEDVALALAEGADESQAGEAMLRIALKQADHRLLAGDREGSLRAYAGVLLRHPASALAWGKLLRWAVFHAAPVCREACFR